MLFLMYLPVGAAMVFNTDQTVGAVVCRSVAKVPKLNFSKFIADALLNELGLSLEHSLSHSLSIYSNTFSRAAYENNSQVCMHAY